MDDLLDNHNKYTPQQAVSLKEMARRANDRIRLFNPTDSDFIVYWDSMGFKIPSKNTDLGHGFGIQILPRYIAINYVQKMKDKIVGDKINIAVKGENEARLGRGAEEMNHYQDRLRFESKVKQDLKDFDKKLTSVLWLGIEEEYGGDVLIAPDNAPKERREDELLAELNGPARTIDKNFSLDALENTPLEEQKVEPAPVAPLPIEPSVIAKQDALAQELAG